MSQPRLERILKQHLRTDQLLGPGFVPLGEVAAAPEQLSSAPPARAAADTTSSTPEQRPREHRPAMPDPHPKSRKEKIELLEQLDQKQVRGCTRCGLCQGRTQTVFGEGDPDADVMFVGEGPGQNEDEQGRPFVGRAGELLNKMIEAMGWKRTDVYIANIVKCRPPNNRAPTPEEVSLCWDHLRMQIAIIRPRAIVTLGGPAAKALLNEKLGITKIRGTWYELQEFDPAIPVMPTFHPAYLLRAYTKENRARVWSDLQQVMEFVK